MTAPMPTRRGLMLGALAAPALLGRAAAQSGGALRIGAVLPLGGSAIGLVAGNRGEAAEAARMGLLSAEEDLVRNAGLLGGDVALLVANAPGAAAAERAARRLVAVDGAAALIGGFDAGEARALARVAEETGTLFLNIGAPDDALRGPACGTPTFHVEASAAMYLDAIAGWFVRAGHRRWHIVRAEDEALAARLRGALDDRHWAAEIVGESVLPAGRRDAGGAVSDLRRSGADLAVCLTDWLSQIDVLAGCEAAGIAVPVTGFPDQMAQTRHFYALSRQTAPAAGTGHRAALWEATLDRYGARELNARFAERWGRPMDPAAWAAYQAMRIGWETALATGHGPAADMIAHLEAEGTVFDVHKGIGVGFRPGDHQLRQSLYLVRINAAEAAPGAGAEPLFGRASLVGELPAIYMPGTDPVERLDQLGDLEGVREC